MKKLYLCKHCGNLADKLIDGGVQMVCCGEPMTELIPQTADSANEKHVPLIEENGTSVKVTVGSTLHPMEEKHHIVFIILETNQGFQKKDLVVDGEPSAVFALSEGEKVIAAYEYCNLHGFWGFEK